MLTIKIIFGIMNGDWKVKLDVIRHYDKFAKIYNTLYGYEQELKIREILKFLNMRKDDIVLDAGCGTGLLFNHISDSSKLIVGVDLSSIALKIALDHIRRRRLDNVSLIRADVDFLPFKDEVFDKVFAVTLLQNMPNPALTIREIMRVVKNRSIFIITGLKKFFSKDDFLRLLSKTVASYSLIHTDENIKCHIAICNKNINRRIGIEMLVVK